MIKVTRLKNPLKRTALRKARARIAAGAIPVGTRPFASTVTRVIPLGEDVPEAVWAVARSAAGVLRGSGPGSLFDIVLHLHADGFRLFPSGREREAFHLGALFDPSEFNALAREHYGATMPGFTAEALRSVLGTPARKVGKETSVEVLLPRIAKALGVKKIEAAPPVLGALAVALCDKFPTWAELSAVDSAVGASVDAVLRAYGHEWPTLQRGWGVSLPEVGAGLGVPTLAFDDQAPLISEQSTDGRFAAVVARYLAELPADEARDRGAAHVQSRITTANGNALSWLFGVGRRGMTELSAAELEQGLNVSSSRGREALGRLRDRVQKLPALSELGERVYQDSRSTLQGTMDSLIAIYVGRLIELDATAVTLTQEAPAIPDCVASGDSEVFAGMSFVREDVVGMIESLPHVLGDLRSALDILLGRAEAGEGGYQGASEAVEDFGQWVTRFNGIAAQINARLKTLDRDASEGMAPLLGGDRWKRLVSMRSPEGPPVEVVAQIGEELDALVAQCRSAYERIAVAHELSVTGALAQASAEIRTSLVMASKKEGAIALATADVELLARRKLLERLVLLSRRGAPALAGAVLAECSRQGLTRPGTATERGLRGYVLSGEQVIYAHPLARRRSIVKLERDGLKRFDFLEFLDALKRDAEERGEVREQLLIELARQALLLGSMPDRVGADLVNWTVPGAEKPVPWVDLRINEGGVARSEVIKAFTGTFHSAISGKLYRLNRTRFSERYDLRCFTGSTLMFSPRDADWTPPVQYRTGKYGAVLGSTEFPWDDASRRKSNGVRVAKHLASLFREVAAEQRVVVAGLMAQLPHDWVVCCDFEGAPTYEGVFASDGEVSNWTKRKGFKLSPPRHFAGAFLEGFKGAGISPHGLTFERLYERNGSQVSERSRRVVAAFPISQPVKPAEARWVPRHLAGFDLGEAGLGVCIKRLSDGEETKLLLRVRKTRLLAHSQERYRRREQPRQAFKIGFNESTGNAIEAAIGDVCGLIDNVIAKYDAVPVFESQAAAARGSNRMVGRVYAGVLQRYSYVIGNDAAESVRTSHWLGAGRWSFGFGADVLPKARTLGASAMEATSNPDNVFRDALGMPGVLANAWRTSVICSACGVDAVGMVEEAIANEQVSFVTDNEGEGVLELGEGRKAKIRIEVPSASELVRRQARQRKRRTPWEAMAGATWTLTRKSHRDDLANAVRRSLRRPPESVQTQGTLSWEFHCACCGQIEQADVNAATNLVRRYLTRVQDNARARGNWSDPVVRREFSARQVQRNGDSSGKGDA